MEEDELVFIGACILLNGSLACSEDTSHIMEDLDEEIKRCVKTADKIFSVTKFRQGMRGK